MEVGDVLGMRHRTRRVAELHIGEFARGLQNIGLMTEGVGKDDVAALVGKVSRLIIAVLVPRERPYG